jgi:hypothetical protein
LLCSDKQLKLAKLLMKYGGKVDGYCSERHPCSEQDTVSSPLIAVCWGGTRAMAKYLLEQGGYSV